ncbi:MAG: prepilin-type N-terminal cleavage/methylation domain-containing protein [Verrucomicrobiota bacterium]
MRFVRSSDEGFSLLEIIMSLAVFGVALVALSGAYVNTIASIERVEVDQGLEQDLNMVRSIVLTLETTDDLEDGGEINTGVHGEVSWRAEYEATGVADLFEVTLFVEMDDERTGISREVEQTVYVTRPTWSDPTERAALRDETRQKHLDFLSGLNN